MSEYKYVIVLLAPTRKTAEESFKSTLDSIGDLAKKLKVNNKELIAEAPDTLIKAFCLENADKIRGMRINKLIVEDAYVGEAVNIGKINLPEWETAVSLAKQRLVNS